MRISLALMAVMIGGFCAGRTLAQEPNDYYRQQIEPILKKACFECHSHASGEASGQLMLDSMAGMTGGGTRGPAVVPGKPEEGWLLKAIGYGIDDLQMPPTGKLNDEQIAVFRKWIAEGARGAPAGSGMSASGIKRLMPDQSQDHWAYRLPQAAQPPSHEALLELARDHLPQLDAASTIDRFSLSRIDRLILAEQLQAGLAPSPTADRRTLARRVTYDLIGLPPTEADMIAFEADTRPTSAALGAWIDRLLASPHFGERFARYWMDIARYADTKGYVFQEDREYKQAFRYRDWLISAFNDSLPYDQFVRAQLAADRDDPKNELGQLPALGFLTLGRRFLNNKNDIIDDRLDVVTRGLMGLTLACARCHDHKYDPISQADYYSLYGVFLNSEEPGGDPWPHRLADAEKRSPTHILIRGSPGNRGDEVQPRFVSFLAPDNATFTDGSGRLELAAKIVSRDNPLTARVIVNRIWLRLFGTSLVDSPSDLGARCPPPKLQAVLDDLAVEFMNSGWDIKSLVRRLITSGVYQQQSVARPEAVAVDAENSLYWRMNRRRVDFETLRDGLMAVSAQLDTRISGPSEKIHEPPFSHRRTVYAYIDRQNLPGLFRNFDVASPDSHSPLRLQTTVPQQGLYLLNSSFIAQLAQQVERRAASTPSIDDAGRVRAMFSTILARQPTPIELAGALALVQQSSGKVDLPSPRWQCGYGHFDPQLNQLVSFAELPYLGEDGWRGGSQLPDSKLGWCLLTKTGGHTGNDLQHAVVRRWIAPRDGTINIKGKLNHKAEAGDGVRATILLGMQQKVDQWQAKHQEQRTNVSGVSVKAGQTVDLVTDCIGDPSHDSFEWSVRIQYEPNGELYDSSKELPGLKLEPMNAWSQLAQALLASNEFAFID